MADFVFRGPPGEFDTRLASINADLGDLLDLIGQRIKETSVSAFQQSRLGEIAWPPQYPGVSNEEFANVAGALQDLNRGGNPKERRFHRKPPLRDTSRLLQSIAFSKTAQNCVEIGTTVEYAPAHQFGLNTAQPVKDVAKKKLAAWMKTAPGKKYGDRLKQLLTMDTLWTQVAERPFLGITDEVEKRIREDVKDFYADRLGVTSGQS